MSDVFDKNIFLQARLTPKHLMPFLPVSRPTISAWLNDSGRVPHKHVLTPVLELQAAVKKALDAGELPLTAKVSSSEAKNRILTIIKRHL